MFLDKIGNLLGGNLFEGVSKVIDQFKLSPEEKAQLEQEILKGYNDDRANARLREMTIKDKLPSILALAVTGGFFGVVYILIFREVPPESQSTLYSLTGVLGTVWIQIISYYFGSSAGSAKKTDALIDTTTKKGS